MYYESGKIMHFVAGDNDAGIGKGVSDLLYVHHTDMSIGVSVIVLKILIKYSDVH